MSNDEKREELSKEEMEKAQGGVGGIKDLHDNPGTDPVPQQRAKPFGKVSTTRNEGGEGQKPASGN